MGGRGGKCDGNGAETGTSNRRGEFEGMQGEGVPMLGESKIGWERLWCVRERDV